jgi:hypothetical protein
MNTPSTTRYREKLDRVVGHQRPLLNAAWKRAIGSALAALPTAILAFIISDKAAIPDWLRHAISPGWVLSLRLTRPLPCGGFLDCINELGRQVGQGVEIILLVNVVIYGLLIFGFATTVSALTHKRSHTI